VSARQDRITLALRDAMKARDKVAVGALRSVLGEIGNAEAVPVDGSSPSNSDAEETPFAGSVEGLGGGEADRRELTDADVISIVQSAMAERLTASEEYRTLGRDDAADVLDAEVAVLRSVLD
jgi:uncharacterized protein YqeY